MENVAIVVDDLDAAVASFTELDMQVEGQGQVEGLWADRTVGLDGVRSEIAMMVTREGSNPNHQNDLVRRRSSSEHAANRPAREEGPWR